MHVENTCRDKSLYVEQPTTLLGISKTSGVTNKNTLHSVYNAKR